MNNKLEIFDYLKRNFPNKYANWINYIDHELFELLHSILKNYTNINFIEMNEIVDIPTGNLTKEQVQINISDNVYIENQNEFNTIIYDIVTSYIEKKQKSKLKNKDKTIRPEEYTALLLSHIDKLVVFLNTIRHTSKMA